MIDEINENDNLNVYELHRKINEIIRTLNLIEN